VADGPPEEREECLAGIPGPVSRNIPLTVARKQLPQSEEVESTGTIGEHAKARWPGALDS
jgi:hypothetical protein